MLCVRTTRSALLVVSAFSAPLAAQEGCADSSLDIDGFERASIASWETTSP